MTEPPRRVRVTHPRTDAASRGPAVNPDEPTEVDEIYLRSLIRSQGRIALAIGAATALLLGGVAVLGAISPAYGRTRIAGFPVSWLILGAGIYPLLILLAWLAVREMERNERDFQILSKRR